MTDLVPTTLNEAGRKHVASELARLGLNWDVDATIEDITSKPSFNMLEPGGWECEYEISNTKAKLAGVKGAGGYGAYAYITIEADKHVVFEEVDTD